MNQKPTAEQAIDCCLPFILKAIKNMENKFGYRAGDLFEDFIQEGYCATLKALDRFDANRGVDFKTFAYKYIFFAIKNAYFLELRHGETYESTDKYDEEAEEFTGYSNTVEDLIADKCFNADYGFTSKELQEKCEALLRKVKNPIDRDIIRMRFGLKDGFEYSYEGISFEHAMSPERARQRFCRGMKQLLLAE